MLDIQILLYRIMMIWFHNHCICIFASNPEKTSKQISFHLYILCSLRPQTMYNVVICVTNTERQPNIFNPFKNWNFQILSPIILSELGIQASYSTYWGITLHACQRGDNHENTWCLKTFKTKPILRINFQTFGLHNCLCCRL